MQETQILSLGWEDHLGKEMATHSSVLVWKIPWMEKPGKATVHGVAKSRTRLSHITSVHFTSQVALVIRDPPANAGDVRDVGSIPGLGRSGEGNGSSILTWRILGESHGQRSLVGYGP